MKKDDFAIQKGNPGAILNKDIDGLRTYKDKRKQQQQTEEKINEVEFLKEDINSMKNDLNDLKNLLLKVLENDKR